MSSERPNAESPSEADEILVWILHFRPSYAQFLYFRPDYAVLTQQFVSLNTSVYRPDYAAPGGHFIPRVTVIEEDPRFVKYNLGIYHLRRADGLLALHQPAQPTVGRALDELQLAERETSPEMTRRLLLIDILRAQAYLQAREYDQALDIALNALEVARKIKSRINRDRIELMYNALSNTGVDAVKLARLGWMLNSW